MNINKFTQNSLTALNEMQSIATEYGNQEIDQEHLFAALLKEDGLIPRLL